MRPPDVSFFKTLYAIGLGFLVGKLILLLTTTGRRTGLPRVTALQYEVIDGVIYLGSSKGIKADWVKNILMDPYVGIRVKNHDYQGLAGVVTDPDRIADFLFVRLERHPRMMNSILKLKGMSEKPSREQLVEYSRDLAMVVVRQT